MERWSKTLNTRLARGGAMAWYSVDDKLLRIRLTPKIAQPVTCQPSPRRAARTTITTRAATESAEAMPEVMLLAISSPKVYLLPATGRVREWVIDQSCQARAVLSLGVQVAASRTDGAPQRHGRLTPHAGRSNLGLDTRPQPVGASPAVVGDVTCSRTRSFSRTSCSSCSSCWEGSWRCAGRVSPGRTSPP